MGVARGEVSKLIAYGAEPDTAVLGLHLHNHVPDHRDCRPRPLQRPARRSGIFRVCGGARQQVLGVDEAATGLAEALRRLLLAEAKHVDALFADASRKSGEIAIGGNEAKAVETAALQ